jgi:hypothetical protein
VKVKSNLSKFVWLIIDLAFCLALAWAVRWLFANVPGVALNLGGLPLDVPLICVAGVLYLAHKAWSVTK